MTHGGEGVEGFRADRIRALAADQK
jgi:hypothetical protein